MWLPKLSKLLKLQNHSTHHSPLWILRENNHEIIEEHGADSTIVPTPDHALDAETWKVPKNLPITYSFCTRTTKHDHNTLSAPKAYKMGSLNYILRAKNSGAHRLGRTSWVHCTVPHSNPALFQTGRGPLQLACANIPLIPPRSTGINWTKAKNNKRLARLKLRAPAFTVSYVPLRQ